MTVALPAADFPRKLVTVKTKVYVSFVRRLEEIVATDPVLR